MCSHPTYAISTCTRYLDTYVAYALCAFARFLFSPGSTTLIQLLYFRTRGTNPRLFIVNNNINFYRNNIYNKNNWQINCHDWQAYQRKYSTSNIVGCATYWVKIWDLNTLCLLREIYMSSCIFRSYHCIFRNYLNICRTWWFINKWMQT